MGKHRIRAGAVSTLGKPDGAPQSPNYVPRHVHRVTNFARLISGRGIHQQRSTR